mmetsp:Transcript_77803/g.172351  ORF Transcript_77803/g.172351 Transcript_77803/m.172351 type:complete len:208 (-) Transcript_77803:394-1017(-)
MVASASILGPMPMRPKPRPPSRRASPPPRGSAAPVLTVRPPGAAGLAWMPAPALSRGGPAGPAATATPARCYRQAPPAEAAAPAAAVPRPRPPHSAASRKSLRQRAQRPIPRGRLHWQRSRQTACQAIRAQVAQGRPCHHWRSWRTYRRAGPWPAHRATRPAPPSCRQPQPAQPPTIGAARASKAAGPGRKASATTDPAAVAVPEAA